jgi:hypothetical protein
MNPSRWSNITCPLRTYRSRRFWFVDPNPPILRVTGAASNGIGAKPTGARAGNSHSSTVHARSGKKTAGAVGLS